MLFVAGEDQTKDANKEKQDSRETKEVRKIDKIKRAAVSALSAAAVKAKLLANQEEDQILQLSTLLIEKQVIPQTNWFHIVVVCCEL